MNNSKDIKRIRRLMWLMGVVKIPMIGFVRPKLISIDKHQAVIKIKLRRRTRNHLKSMYFGAMSVGADLAAGLHVFYLVGENHKKLAFVFKSVKGEFHRRAETDVLFVCNEGVKLQKVVSDALRTGERINESVEVLVKDMSDEVVATFQMEISVKFR